MKLKVDVIREKGLDLEEPLQEKFVLETLGLVQGMKLLKPGTLKAHFDRVGTEVLIKASLECDLETPCKRCVDPVALPLRAAFELVLVPTNKFTPAVQEEGEDDGGGLRAGTFAFEQADHEPFDGQRIDMDHIVREQLLLALPVSVLCKEDCKGLCTVCGHELNVSECGCERKPVDVRMLKLKDIKLQ